MRALIILFFTALSLSTGLGAIVESYSFTNINRAIPDGVASGMQDTRTIQSSIASIGEVTVTLKISGMDSGAYNGDLYVALQHESGLAVLLNRVGRSSTNKYGYGDSGFDVQFKDGGTNGDVHLYRLRANGSETTPIGGILTGSWQPDARVTDPSAVVSTNARSAFLQQFRGMSATGGWTLLVTDVSPGGRAQLDGWSLDISTDVPKPLYSVTKVTTGAGSIVLTPAKAGYSQDETFQSIAVPDTGYMFTRWEGIASGKPNPASLSISSNSVLVAQFSKIWSLTLRPTAGGSISSSASGTNVVDGTTVALTVVPSVGYIFTGWVGDVTGTNNPVSFAMLTNKTVSANFVAQYALNVAVVGGGTVAQAPLKSTYTSGDSVTLTATASAGWAFTGWSGDAISTTTSFVLLMNGNKSIAATFKRIWTVSSSVLGTGGTVTLSPVKAAYLDGSSVTATAVSSNGFRFIGWSGDLSSLSNIVTMILNTNKVIVAKFAPSFILTLPAVTGGTVAASPQQPDYASNSVVTLTAVPSAGYLFKAWTNNATGSTNPTQLIMNQPKTVQPVFVQGLTLSTNVVGAGSLMVAPARSLYFPGETVTITAVAGQGSAFIAWSGASTSTNPILSLTISSNTAITANFIAQYALTTTAVGGGTVLASPSKTSYLPGESVTVTATPSAGWTFIGWSGASTVTTPSIVLVMNSANSLTATFQRLWTVSSSVSGAGSVSLTPNQATYLDGTTLTAVATPAPGNKFIGWSGDLSSLTTNAPLLVNTNKAIIAKFAPLITLNILAATGGTAIASPQQSEYVSNSVVGVTAIPSAGYLLKCWTNDASGAVNPYSLTMNQSKTVQPIFVQGLTLTTNVVGAGSLMVVPARSLYFPGETVTITAVAGQGSAFIAWSGASTSTNPILSLTISSNTSITANFGPYRTLLVTTNGLGSVAISPSAQSYVENTVVSLKASAGSGWTFANWSGALSSTSNPLYLVMNGNKSVTANFVHLWPLSLSSAIGGTAAVTPLSVNGYVDGSTVSISANAAPGYVFTGWTGDLVSTNNPASLVMDSAKLVSPVFQRVYQVTLGVAGNGTLNKPLGVTNVVEGTMLTLVTTSGSGARFAGWTGSVNASYSATTLSVTVNTNLNLLATFLPIYTLTIVQDANGVATPVPLAPFGSKGEKYFAGTNVSLTAVAKTGYVFVDWIGTTNSKANPLVLTMTSNQTLTPRFASLTAGFLLDRTVWGDGTVTVTPNKVQYAMNDLVLVQCVPAVGSTFGGVSGSGAPSDTNQAAFSILMDGDKTLLARFISPRTISVNTTGLGSVGVSPIQSQYLDGTLVTFTTVSAPGYRFAGWTGGTNATYSTSTLTVKVSGNLSLTANFLPVYSLTVSSDSNGSVSRTPLAPFGPNLEKYFPGTNVTLTATPKAGYQFVQWTINGSASSNNPVIVVMNSANVVVATFAPSASLSSLNLSPKTVTLNWDKTEGIINLGVSENEGESVIEISNDLKDWQELGGVFGSNFLARKPSGAVEFYRVRSAGEFPSAR